MNELILKENNPERYVVTCLPDGTMFVHDKESGENFFSQKTIVKLTGLTQQSVSHHLKRFGEFSTNTNNICISLEVSDSVKPVVFYSFSALTYVAFRSNKKEAVEMREYINSQLNKMFNYDVGFEKPEQPISLEREVRETIQYFKSKVWEYTVLAFESETKERFIEYQDVANKYALEAKKREFQLNNVINCNNRLKREVELNKDGFLTESGEKRIFLPDTQSTLLHYPKLLRR